MKYKDNIAAVAKLRPDFLGFIFYEKSARHFDTSTPELPKAIKKVGVFVDEKVEVIVNTIERHQLDVIQLHGHESPEICRLLKTTKKELIKVFSIKNNFDFSVLKHYEDVVDYFLFDTKGKLPGGNGYTFNWDVLKNYPSTKPYFLSGGIGLDEIGKIKDFKKSKTSTYCYAIDVNSKFEIEVGMKDVDELKQFIKNLNA